jgi:Leucine-rich repeat (LRR) protein
MGNIASDVEESMKQRKAESGELEGVVRARDAFIMRGQGLRSLSTTVVHRFAVGCRLLDVSGNTFVALPAAVCTLPELQTLIAHTNSLRSLPSEMASLHALTALDLSRNQLQDIDCDLPVGLRVLRLAENELIDLPDSLFARCTALEVVHLAHNEIRYLPSTLERLRYLRELDVRHNRLKEMPNVGEDLVHLERLLLEGNRIRDMRAAPLQALKGLRVLSIAGNPLRCPLDPDLPAALSNLTNLTISDNRRIVALPFTWTGDAKLLRACDAVVRLVMDRFESEGATSLHRKAADDDSDGGSRGSSDDEEDEDGSGSDGEKKPGAGGAGVAGAEDEDDDRRGGAGGAAGGGEGAGVRHGKRARIEREKERKAKEEAKLLGGGGGDKGGGGVGKGTTSSAKAAAVASGAASVTAAAAVVTAAQRKRKMEAAAAAAAAAASGKGGRLEDDVGEWVVGLRIGEEKLGRTATAYQVLQRSRGTLPPTSTQERLVMRVDEHIRANQKLRNARAQELDRQTAQVQTERDRLNRILARKGASESDEDAEEDEEDEEDEDEDEDEDEEDEEEEDGEGGGRRKRKGKKEKSEGQRRKEEEEEFVERDETGKVLNTAERRKRRVAYAKEQLDLLTKSQTKLADAVSQLIYGFDNPLSLLSPAAKLAIVGSGLVAPTDRLNVAPDINATLQWKRLRHLAICNASVRFLPDSFGGFVSLQSLDLSGTPITSLPDAIFFTCPILESLLCRGCKLSVIPPSIGVALTLTTLDFSNNELVAVSLPESLGRLSNLIELDLSGNRELRELPDPAIYGWSALELLKLSEMPELPLPESIRHLRSLAEIHVHPRQVERAPDRVVLFLANAGVNVVLT